MRPQTIVERLDFVAKRVQGLKFTPPTQLKPGDDQFYGCFMSCDMYYIEIKVDQSHQSVKDVIISHGNSADGISCPVLKKVLADQDFETFAKHLTGLHSIYQINTNDKKVKQRAYPALTALEADLTILYDHQRRRVNNLHDLVHKSPIGFMEPRKGGLPVKLTYFITPYDLIDTTHKSLISITANNIVDKNLGLSATVEIEGSSPHKIQIKSLITQHNSSLPIYAPFNSQNSEKLPAQFVLKLSQPFPMLNTSISQIINEINEPATIREFLSSIMTSSKESIISLIARQELDLNKGPFCRTVDSLKGADSELCDLKKHVYSVKLPDQSHTYHILDNYLERPDAVYVTKIPFTHPTSIPSILKVLRQQALFNFVLGSCIRRNKGSTNNASTVANHNIDENLTNNSQVPNIFDVLPVSLNSVCVAFEHPSRESLATLELDIREISCQLYALDKESVCSDEFATKVLQKCWSIPVTLRSVLKKCNERRLALLEDSNKRRERELQELLSNNSSTQQNLQLKPNLKYRDTIPQSNPNSSSEKSNPRDLNSIAEFLSNKVNNANTSDNHRQNDANFDNSSSRTNLLKKFSCKPKVKQNTTTKSQIGNKILSQMLKRQNSTIVIDDPVLRGPVTKKIKTKNLSGESTSAETSSTPTLTTTKLISPEVANAARLMNKQAKQAGKNQSISLSLIRAPNKTQASAMSSTTRVNLSLTTNQKPPDPSVQKVKSQTNGSGSPVDLEGARKTSINAIIDKICLGVNDEKDGKNESDQQAHSDQANFPINSMDTNRNADSQKGTSNGAKTKTRAPGGDQFAIKQGSSGGGLKLTVTKTKPSNATMPSSSTQSITLSATNSNPSSTSTSTSSNSSTSSSSNSNPNSKQSDASKIIDLGLAAPSIRYTIPKISKTQQASQSSTSNANSSDNTANVSSNDVSQPDESTNPSSSGNSSTAPSSTTTKRTTSNPFNRNGNTNRNSVSSSTHPSNRTSNPLANALSRPSSTSNIDNHIMNRISSSSNNGQPGAANSRIPQVNRPMNMMPQTRMPAQTIMSQQPFNVAQRFINPGLMAQQSQASLPLIGQPLPQQMFALRMQQQGGIFSNPNDLNIIAANQVALLNQQQQQLQQQRQQISQQTLNSQVQSIQQHQQASVSSSSDTSREDRKLVSDSQAATSSSTPSSPTECDQAQIIAPPPLIPIDSLHEARPASPDEEHDDASDRLSIVDMVDFADGNSIAGTPKPNEVSSPKEVSHDSNSASSSSIPAAQSGPEMSAPTSMSRSDLGSAATTTTVTAAVSAASTATNSTTASTSNVTANQDAIVGSASTTADDSVNASASSSFISEQTDLAPVSAASHNTNSAPSGKPVTTSEQHVMQPPEISPSLDTDMAITAQSPQSTITATTQDE